MNRFLLFILVFVSFIVDSYSEVADSTKIKSDSVKFKKVKIVGFPLLGKEPETGFYTGALAMSTMHFYRDTTTRFSTFKIELNLTQKKQVILGTVHNIFLKDDSYYFYGNNTFFKFPENFYGIGNKTTKAMQERYDANRIDLNNAFLKRFTSDFYAGLTYRMERIYNLDPADGGLLEKPGITGNKGGTSSGLGYIFNFDTRKNILNPKSGYYVSVANLYFGKAFGSQFKFIRVEGDARKYFKMFPKKFKDHILAVQFYGVFNQGNPPFRMLALLGSENHMRGYYMGRYRDKNYLSFQAEYRMPLFWILGMTAFAGAGDVSNRLDNFRFNTLKPTYGLGLRIRVDKHDDVNMRFDFAFGKQTSGFYVVFGEAF